MKSITPRRMKIAAAVAGGSAVLALGAVSAALGAEPEGTPVAKSMEIGSTSTETTPSDAPATTMAVPIMKGPAPLPSEEKAAE
jgi:hypothetical protein